MTDPGQLPVGKVLDGTKINDLLSRLTSLKVDRYLKDDLGKEKSTGLSPARNRILLRDGKGEPVFELAWGAAFKDESPKASSGPERRGEYYAQARLKAAAFTPAIGLAAAEIDSLPLKDVFKDKAPAPDKTPGKTPEKTNAQSNDRDL